MTTLRAILETPVITARCWSRREPQKWHALPNGRYIERRLLKRLMSSLRKHESVIRHDAHSGALHVDWTTSHSKGHLLLCGRSTGSMEVRNDHGFWMPMVRE